MDTMSDAVAAALANAVRVSQAARKIARTTTTLKGHVLDWVPLESQVASGRIASPPPMSAMPVRVADPHQPIHAAGFELEAPNAERGPAGTVPLLRADPARLSSTLNVQNFTRKRGGLLVNRSRRNLQPTDPNPAGYFHQTDSQNGTFYGWDGFINVWDPSINTPGGNGTDHSIMQVWMQNYDKPQLQSIEGGWTVDQSLNGDTQPHIFIFYTTNGYTQEANNLGGYNTQFSGWVQYSSTIYPGAALAPVSVWGGQQYDISMKFQLYKEPTNGELNWWIAVQGQWMGYYPASLFNGGLGNHAEWFGVGGEVYSSLGNPEQTADQMGSGWKAAAGWTKAAFMRNLRTQSDMNGTMANNSGSAEGDAAVAGGADPYTLQLDMNSGSSWGSYFYVGGPTALPPPTATFNEITFVIGTGGDDLRGDSSATATVMVNGSPHVFTLKAQSDPGWGNNTTHTKSFAIGGAAQPLSAFGAVSITLTSHNAWFETDDNWNIQSVDITLEGPGGTATLRNRGGNPFARLTGSAPTVTV